MERLLYSYGKQSINDEDIAAVVDTLRGDWLTQGPKVREFEVELSKKLGAKHASVVSNGTAALHLCAIALGWTKDDIVITSPLTFLASANCILYAGATPDFVDIDKRTYTIDLDQLEAKLLKYRKSGKRVKAVIGVDYAGQPCDWKSLRELANKFDLQLVNDSCHALGAEIDGDAGYGVEYADVVVLSFHPVKHITSGEGGAVLTNSISLDNTIRTLRTHGMTKDERTLEKNDGPWYYEMHQLGFNYRITDFQCALGLSQLKKLDHFISERARVAKFYANSFENDERFVTPFVRTNVKHAYHLYPLQINFSEIASDKQTFFSVMRANGIGLQVHYIPVHLQPFYRKNFGFKSGDFKVAEEFYRKEVSIPMYPKLEQHDLEYISEKIRSLAK